MRKYFPVLFFAMMSMFACKKNNPPVSVSPGITAISPTNVHVGDTITISGAHFTGTTSVMINGMNVTFTVINDSTIIVVIPQGTTSGPVTVTTTNGTISSTINIQMLSKLVAYSSAFVNNGLYPKLYTCDSAGISPPISWRDAPVGTNAYAITMHTIPPTGANHVYMVVYNLPSSVTSLPENNTTVGTYGANSFPNPLKYDPPCSQGPGLKYYYLTVYALSQQPNITVAQNQVTMDYLKSAISNITLDTSMITVGYARP